MLTIRITSFPADDIVKPRDEMNSRVTYLRIRGRAANTESRLTWNKQEKRLLIVRLKLQRRKRPRSKRPLYDASGGKIVEQRGTRAWSNTIERFEMSSRGCTSSLLSSRTYVCHVNRNTCEQRCGFTRTESSGSTRFCPTTTTRRRLFLMDTRQRSSFLGIEGKSPVKCQRDDDADRDDPSINVGPLSDAVEHRLKSARRLLTVGWTAQQKYW